MKFRFIPLNGKIPIFENWQQDATNEPTKLGQWGQVTKEFGIVTGQGFIAIDVDVKGDGFANLAAKGIELPTTLKQTTQSGGAHYFYKTNKQFKNSVSKIAKGVDVRSTGGQVKIYDWSIIHKYNEMTELPKHIEDILLKDNTDSKKQIPVRYLSPETELDNILQDLTDAPEGERNATLFVKSCEVKSKLVNNGQLNQDHAYQRVFDAATAMGLKPSECKATINSGFKTIEIYTLPFTPVIVSDMTGINVKKDRWLPNKPTMADLKNKSRLRRPQIFKDYSSRDITLINADGGTGKTTKLLFETVHAALGMPCYGFICLGKFKTLYITGEDDAEKLYAMLGMISEALNLSEAQFEQVMDSVRIKKDVDLTLISKDKMGFLIPNYAALNEMVKELEDFRPDRIIFDPIASFWGSEAALNDMSKAVAKWCGLLRDALNCEVILVNHIGKASSQSKDITQFAGRGGSALPSHARINKVMRRLDATEYAEMTGLSMDEGDQALLEVCTKFTDYSPILDKPIVYIRKGFTFGKNEIKKQHTENNVDSRSDDEIIYEFILHNETNGIDCTKKFIESMLTGKISRARIGDTLTRLVMVGLNGKKILLTDANDLTINDKAYKTQQ